MPLEARDITAIEQLGERFADALNRGDVSSITGMLADDAMVIPTRRNPSKGANAIRRFLLSFAQQMQNVKLLPTDLDPLGADLAREVGTISFRVRGGTPSRVVGRYLFLWQRTDGGWKLATFIWNRTPPAAEAPAGPAAGDA